MGALLIAGVTASCAPERSPHELLQVRDVGRAQTEIKDGYDDAEDTGVMAITSLGGGLCTGSLIAPNVVLTARHCVSSTSTGSLVQCGESTFSDVGLAASFLVTSAQAVDPANAGEFGVAEVVGLAGIAGIPGAVANDKPFCGNDIAMLILDENVPASVAVPYLPRLDDDPVVAGVDYYAVGYGATNGAGDGAGRRRRRDELAVTCVDQTECTAAELLGVVDGEWAGNGGVCQGDSGGPALDLDNRVIGVTSRGDEACEISVYGNPAAFSQWVKDVTVFASGMGNYTAPSWTEGSTVDPTLSLPMGENCSGPEDCAAGICFDDGNRKFCSRLCDAEVGTCPDGYQCLAADGRDICRFPPPPPSPGAFKRADDDGCSVVAGSEPSSREGLVWLMMAFAACVRGGRRRR